MTMKTGKSANGKKDIYVLGISESHNASACLIKNGEVIGAVSEERFVRKKNFQGLPEKSMEYLLNLAGISGKSLDLVAFSFNDSFHHFAGKAQKRFLSSDTLGWPTRLFRIYYYYYKKLFYYFPFLSILFQAFKRVFYVGLFNRFLSLVRKYDCKRFLNNGELSILSLDHHLAHAYATYFSVSKEKESRPHLVFICDGGGDGLSAGIYLFDNYRLKRVVSEISDMNGLGHFFLDVTTFLGMEAGDEYKVMGLAPYASDREKKRCLRIYDKLFYITEKLKIASKYSRLATETFMEKKMKRMRFDGIAGAAQETIEKVLVEWIKKTIEKEGIKHVVAGGGIFQNIKANLKISKKLDLDSFAVCPAAGDESTAIGVAYWAYERVCKNKKSEFYPKTINTLYLGPDFSSAQIESCINSLNMENPKGFKITNFDNDFDGLSRTVASHLARGEIVAVFSGRLEWGPRALGNRSILANPKDPFVIKKLNTQIKNRDFWMPFGATILKEREHEYIFNEKGVDASFMTIAFETTPLARQELVAGIHPFDYTMRPQVLSHDQNGNYYKIIKEFERLTGVAGLLNTSFNLHGEPIVCSPQDALNTFSKSGLRFLALGDFLIEKTDSGV